jgi:hypothetical protein
MENNSMEFHVYIFILFIYGLLNNTVSCSDYIGSINILEWFGNNELDRIWKKNCVLIWLQGLRKTKINLSQDFNLATSEYEAGVLPLELWGSVSCVLVCTLHKRKDFQVEMRDLYFMVVNLLPAWPLPLISMFHSHINLCLKTSVSNYILYVFTVNGHRPCDIQISKKQLHCT